MWCSTLAEGPFAFGPGLSCFTRERRSMIAYFPRRRSAPRAYPSSQRVSLPRKYVDAQDVSGASWWLWLHPRAWSPWNLLPFTDSVASSPPRRRWRWSSFDLIPWSFFADHVFTPCWNYHLLALFARSSGHPELSITKPSFWLPHCIWVALWLWDHLLYVPFFRAYLLWFYPLSSLPGLALPKEA